MGSRIIDMYVAPVVLPEYLMYIGIYGVDISSYEMGGSGRGREGLPVFEIYFVRCLVTSCTYASNCQINLTDA